jgi:hypothetical protein
VLAFALLLIAIGVAEPVGESSAPPLSCEPKKLRPGDTLILQFRLPHPKELAIRAPGNVWYFLVYEPDKNTPQPAVDKAAFAQMREMRLPVRTAEGTPWAAGKTKNGRIFQQSGTYEVVLTDNLESEGVPAFRCRITFAKSR